MGCFPVDFQDVKRPLRTKSVKRPIKVGKRPFNKGKRPIKAKVLVGLSVGSLMGCFRAPPTWRKTAPLKRPIKRSMSLTNFPECFPHLFLSHFEPKTSHNARFWGPNTLVFSEVTGPQQFERTKKKCPMDLRKLLTPFLLTPPPEGLLNNANE